MTNSARYPTPIRVIRAIRGLKRLGRPWPNIGDEMAIHPAVNNGVNLDKTPAALGPMLTIDAGAERFAGEFSEEANTF
jgi:hypothetical protein